MFFDDTIHNFYEKLVNERIAELGLDRTRDRNYLADLCCLALNQLPCKYIRHDVDMAFYQPVSERLDMEMRTQEAVTKAITFLDDREQSMVNHAHSAPVRSQEKAG